MSGLRAIRDLVLKNFRLAKGVHEGSSTGTGGTCIEGGMSETANTVALYYQSACEMSADVPTTITVN